MKGAKTPPFFAVLSSNFEQTYFFDKKNVLLITFPRFRTSLMLIGFIFRVKLRKRKCQQRVANKMIAT